MGESIVEEWLRSLNLVHYTQDFLDNGYDDLEVCKQIGDLDLDAIGVLDAEHRRDILDAVKVLREKGGTAVYFTLENPDYHDYNGLYTDYAGQGVGAQLQLPGKLVAPPLPLPRPWGMQSQGEGEDCLLTYPALQLTSIVRDRLAEADINLAASPYVQQDGTSENLEKLEEIAKKYAEDLKTHQQDVLERLQMLQKWGLSGQDESSDHEDQFCASSLATRNTFGLFSICGQSSRSVPPPLPSCPPPSSTYAEASDMEQYSGVKMAPPTTPGSSPRHGDRSAADGTTDGKAAAAEEDAAEKADTLPPGHSAAMASAGSTSTMGRLLKNIGLRKSGRKYVYKQHEGDPNASDITMSSEDRIQLMVLVKEGKISSHSAMEIVKQFEKDKKSKTLPVSESGQLCKADGESQCSNPDALLDDSSSLSTTWEYKYNSSSSSSPSFGQSPETVTKFRSGAGDLEGATSSSPAGARKKTLDSKPMKSSKLSCSPAASPSKQGRKGSADSIGSSPKEKMKTLFSSPFNRRKGSTADSKGKAKDKKVEGVAAGVSPGLHRRGSDKGSPCDLRRGSAGSRSLSQSPLHSPAQYDSATVIHSFGSGFQRGHQSRSFQVPRASHSCDTCMNTADLPKAGPGPERTMRSTQEITLRTFGKSSSVDCRLPPESAEVVEISKRRSAASPSPSRSQGSPSPKGHQTVAIVHRPDDQSSESGDLTLTPGRSPKRHTPPTSATPPESHSPKRQHMLKDRVVEVVDAGTYEPHSVVIEYKSLQKPEGKEGGLRGESPDLGVDTSPTGTLDSEDMKDSKYGSSSTMSVGSEASPTPDRKKKGKTVLDKISKYSRPRSNSFSTGDECLSSDYDEELEQRGDDMFLHSTTNQGSISNKVKDFRKEVKRRLSGHPKGTGSRPEDAGQEAEMGDRLSTESRDSRPQTGSSVESMHSAMGMRVVSSSSSHSSMSVDEDQAVYRGTFVARARAKMDCTPSPYDREALTLKKGDIINVISMNETGMWRGVLHGRVGSFKCVSVDLLPDTLRQHRQCRTARRAHSKRPRPKTVEDLLQRLGLQHLVSVFLLNGYETLDLFSELEDEDLDELKIVDGEDRAKIITAAQMLLDYDEVGESPDKSTDASGASSHSPATISSSCDSPHHTATHISKDSGIDASADKGLTPDSAASPARERHIRRGGQSTVHVYDDFAFTECDANVQRTQFDPKDSGVPERATDASDALCGMELGQFTQEDQEIISITHNGEITISTKKTTPLQNGKITTPEEDKPDGDSITQVNSTSTISETSTITEADLESSTSSPAPKADSPNGKPPSGVVRRPKVKPQVPQRSSSLSGSEKMSSTSSSSPSPTEVQLRDVSTQHSGIEDPAVIAVGDPLLVASQVLQSKVKTAHVRQLSPGGRMPRSKSHTPPSSPARGSRLPTAVPSRKVGSRSSPRHSVPGAIRRGRSASPGLMGAVKTKLKHEGIKLSDHPYSHKTGQCGIPPALVQRYAEELHRDVYLVAAAMEEMRVRELSLNGKTGICNDLLGESCISPVLEGNPSSLPEFLISLGLPMYLGQLAKHYSNMADLRTLSESDLKKCGVSNANHGKRLVIAIEALEAQGDSDQHMCSPGGVQKGQRVGKLAKFKDKV